MPYRMFSVSLTRAQWNLIAGLLQKELVFCGECFDRCNESCYYNLSSAFDSIKTVIDHD